MPSKRLLAVCAASTVTAVVLAGCGSSSSGGTPSAGGSTPTPGASTQSVSTPATSGGASTPSTLNSSSPGPAASESRPGTSPLPAEGEDTATLEAGRYVTSDPFPVSVSVTVPAGWKSEEPGAYVVFLSTADGVGNDGPATLALLLAPLEFSDPCTTDDPGTSVASVDDFVKAVAAMRGAKVTRPKDVTVGGLKGRQVTLSAPAKSVSCTGGNGVVMTLALGHQFMLSPGETMSLTAIDDSGVLLIVEEKTTPVATAEDRAQIAKVLQSMSIGGST
jgi:hypothetical protein